ncbi:MAG: LuxR C-terminal-related transcriptional regulator [Cyanobacteria bacterium J06650_10]
METLVTSDLKELFNAIAQAKSKPDLTNQVMAQIGTYFSACRWRLWFHEELLDNNTKISTLIQQAISIEKNPVLRYLVQRHSAVHDEIVLPAGVWKTICPRADHGHVMVGPVIAKGDLIGGISVTRHRNEAAFNAENLADLSALSLHVSTKLATFQTDTTATKCLTPREIQIAELVAQGLTNKKVGTELWITENSVKQALKRMFRKLSVSSRAEMVAKLGSQR